MYILRIVLETEKWIRVHKYMYVKLLKINIPLYQIWKIQSDHRASLRHTSFFILIIHL